MNFKENFRLFRRKNLPCGGLKWVPDVVFTGAVTKVRLYEVGHEGRGGRSRGQVAEVSERANLYIFYEKKRNLPGYDDFVERLETGVMYRVVTDPRARKVPEISRLYMYICEIERGDFYEDGYGYD